MSDPALEIRGCTSREELEEVVSLCDAAFPKTSREYFARHVLKDRTLAPADTRILVKDRNIVSSVQVFPRTMYCRGEKIGFGGIGNVATLPSEREKGYAGSVLRDALEYIRDKKLPVSLLTTTINPYYGKFGFQTIRRHVVQTEFPRAGEQPGVRTFDRDRDLDRVIRLYNRFNVQFVGTLVRDVEYWDSQLEFCDEDKSLFYVHETEGELRGFIRAIKKPDHVQVLEYGFAGNQQEIRCVASHDVGQHFFKGVPFADDGARGRGPVARDSGGVRCGRLRFRPGAVKLPHERGEVLVTHGIAHDPILV